MAQKKQKKRTVSTKQKVGIGVGLTAAAVAAAGTYFLYGSSNTPQNRKRVKSWMLKAKAEVLEALEKAEDMTQKEYEEIIDSVGRVYGAVQGAAKGDVANFKKEMKSHWNKIRKSGMVRKVAARATRGAVRGGARKVQRRATKKSSRKGSRKVTKQTGKKTKGASRKKPS